MDGRRIPMATSLLLGVEAVGSLVGALMAYVVTTLPVGDHEAFDMTQRDWILRGLNVLALVTVAVAMGSALVWAANRAAAEFGLFPRGWVRRSALAAAGTVLLGGAIGTAQFIIDKPFM
ncbi:MAG TPA: hypothetical protein VM840_08630 [Actinomycetota bacterium]|jgi:hypothetical protein|nr:hypothetical protein [Actinomycetota bacterium]